MEKPKSLLRADENLIEINCYRIKIEFIEPNVLRIYTFNSIEKGGDNAVEVHGDIWELKVYSEYGHPQNPIVITNPNINPSRKDEKAYARKKKK